MQDIIYTHDICNELAAVLSRYGNYDRIFVLTDENTERLSTDILKECNALNSVRHIVIKPGDGNKSIESVMHVWRELSINGATRHSCLVNVGGGMVTDLGGFAASTFKRGIDFINIPTTLLSMVDASVGGKTGFNFEGLKNEIGVFKDARSVLISTVFLRSLSSENILSGYAEMLKHSLLGNEDMWKRHLRFDPLEKSLDLCTLQEMIKESVMLKERIVTTDPTEKGLRKALNFGHTIGHAIESLSISKGHPVLHGFAVAYGIVAELFLSCIIEGLPTIKMRQTAQFVFDNYGHPDISCSSYDTLFRLMLHDKKNNSGIVNFTLLSDIGKIDINMTATKQLIFESLDFLREG